MEEFYPEAFSEFWKMVRKQKIYIPSGVARGLGDDQYEKLYNSTVVHEKPLTNALGLNYQKILNKERVIELFNRM